tara:strand:+ start:341 stop:541 length:201 start_codon:yes stop_codon:yes gene_type:complete
MSTINIEGKEYELDSLTEDQKVLVDELVFLQGEIRRFSYVHNSLDEKYKVKLSSLLSTLDKEEKEE